MLHLFGQLREMFTDLRVAPRRDGLEGPSRRRTRLHVPQINRGRTASHPQQNS